ncbi:tRNA (adenosine(37)-N6)-threonylcarbamoyltransferase complex dimerization subunit type 1 TsaB [Winogradskyella immobilis]|uniref:tRNA (Adenosine(37)-N6)-threonylcarbamoyltransferase complex dimerization subunit type 1 TsaB n=1 Tax=Winogradskyella immobilis TaxID=2816852 RepID=A0ABS8EJ90_9FLAO|nr:tRNA (adenosine(37)-N6)-threonylcarbamoyltransferase complex dimerization subunit type 1 TsaB [Winogradskyella immobilis]MCC1483026.1 tRNA (adenosine(37)-N6)-threonylcarbamoyltransferase complex dimerization subunit type 1 TsaB [Winogradskyella immobilis]MCG0015121.1 tRNA (adenosine(37)-N6)-threonylcarbamoyltransferase complex dimerization subunit type 1 TsaB [Winogradskyella immobilis]
MAIILNIETTTTNCSVSLSQDGETLVLKENNDSGFSHAEKLHVFIKDIFELAKIGAKDIDAISISKGPGSYTGLRIGVSTAKGLCYSLDKPLISISTLLSLAHQINVKEKELIVPMLDARRMEVYSAIYNPDFSIYREIEAQIIDKFSFSSLLESYKLYFIGSGAEKMKSIINHPNAVFIDNKYPSASTMGFIANKKFKISAFENLAYFEPYYLKDFVAIKAK